MEFLSKYGLVIFSGVVFLGVFFKFKKKAHQLGDNIGDRLPETVRKEMGEYIEAFAEGLKGENYDGDGNLVSNTQIDNAIQKVKIDLGLKE
ncbi:hypothetical protein [Ilyobacter polytropus]|uniref:Uncharacterized protein n=1 Tax=Ilyobacter polytropus (strain ATCC 51220 / DSM 2926 / LMG 16218 / CuHBu1) TaxID=572544 RepID=E3HBN8_ILYPC|nr:hypothetical protein [Ilyobacter polytropus]ADO83800.1 hypothetical protein Ilyop_2029 [Ilyobacter polytropus DSM 2926]